MPQGEKVDVLEETSAAWDKVRYNGVVGYMMAKVLSKVSDDTAADARDSKRAMTYQEPYKDSTDEN